MDIAEGRMFGVFPILATPFTEDGSVDEVSLRSLTRFLLNAGVHGLALFGMASEAYALSEDEKRRILAIVKEEVNGRVPLIIGSGHASADCAVQLSRAAQRDGAAALMVMAPYMVKPDGIRLYEYFAAIAAAVDIPIMIQDAPNATGVSIPAALVGRLYREFDNVRYIKVEAPPTIVKISEVLEATEGGISVFGGMNGVFMFEEFMRGSVGTMPACEFPEIAVRIFNAYRAGDTDEARRVFVRHLPLFRMGTLPNYAMAIHKQILYRRGVISTGNVRNPNAVLDARLMEDVSLLMKEMRL